jgi:hypothetical protein
MSFLKGLLRKEFRVAVLGCGPAGMFAAHALAEKGHDVAIYSRRRRSDLFGCQYLHAPIPGLSNEDESRAVKYELVGTPDGYRTKVYGASDVKTSVETLGTDHTAWDIRSAYLAAWTKYCHLITDVPDLGPQQLVSLGSANDWVVSSIPANRLCYGEHEFRSQEIYAIGDAPERGVECPVDVAGDEHIICDGTRDRGWYRQAKVFGYRTVEWPGGKRPPYANVAKVNKPTSNNCDCFLEEGKPLNSFGVLKVGRYGTWDKRVLSHQAYEMAGRI